MLAKIMQVDPYFITQDNGAGAPIHFAVTYRQLDMVHHLLNCGAHVNQRDPRGFTPLHRAAHLAHLDGYLEMYEYLLSRGADPSILTEDYDPYLDPGPKTPQQVAADDPRIKAALQALEDKYASVPKAPRAHPDLGDWWALYDYGPEVVGGWPADYVHPYPEELARQRSKEEKNEARRLRREKREAYLASLAAGGDGSEVLAAFAAREAPAQPGTTPITAAATATASATAMQQAGTAAPAGPAKRTVFLFPGQGSQAVGMLAAAAASGLPSVTKLLDTAKEVLGYDLLELCVNGPQTRLDDTAVAQPALFVAGLAAVELLRARDPAAVDGCVAAAGLSLGEYTALVFAGALGFEEGLRVVKARGEAMAAAAKADPSSSSHSASPSSSFRPHGMLSVVGLGDVDLDRIVAAAAAGGPPGTVCRVANYLFPQGRVVSGHTDALQEVAKQALAAGALKAQMLQVSGAFHTPLMAPAKQQLEKVLSEVTFRAPRLPVLSNVTAQPFPSCPGSTLALGGHGPAGGDPRDIPALLSRQLVEPVRWEATLAALLAPPAGPGAPQTSGVVLHELGPGQQIKAMVKRLSLEAWRSVVNVQP